MEPFKIESNIPAPPPRQKLKAFLPFGSMKIGDSFFIPDELAISSKSRALAAQFQIKNTGYQFTIRTVPGGVRVWRIEVESDCTTPGKMTP